MCGITGGDRFCDKPVADMAVRGWAMAGFAGGLAVPIARLALLKYRKGEASKPEELKACYVRPAEAEIKLSMGLLGSKIKRSLRPEKRENNI